MRRHPRLRAEFKEAPQGIEQTGPFEFKVEFVPVRSTHAANEDSTRETSAQDSTQGSALGSALGSAPETLEKHESKSKSNAPNGPDPNDYSGPNDDSNDDDEQTEQ